MAATAAAAPDGHEAGARHALLQRLANDLAVLREPHKYHWTCCWLSYEKTGYWGQPERWGWKMCAGQMPGTLPIGPDGRYISCGHWHHRHEVFLALG